ncbi:MAG: hypothetical protein AAGC88_05660, partial [Bacteroidota bacterium]
MNFIKHTTYFFGLAAVLFLSACGDDDDPPAPITVNFTSSDLGITDDVSTVTASIALSRNVDQDETLTVRINNNNLTYGEDADYYTVPAATGDELSIAVATSTQDASFQVLKGSGLNIQQDEFLTFALVSTSDNIVVGDNSTVTVSFSENFIAPSGTIELNAGGAAFPDQAFFDFSKSTQSNVGKYTWDLGFSSASGEFAVVLNAAAYHMARSLETTDMAAVTAEDTIGFAGQMVIPQFDPSAGAIAWVDTPDGDLTTTAFGDIASSEEEANVFIVRRVTQDWQKVKVFRDGDGYQVQWAAIDDASFNGSEVIKDDEYNFMHFSFESGEASIEPAKASWDIMYSTYTTSLNLGGPGLDIPYGFNDYITMNRNNTEVAMVMIEDIAYDAFGTADANGLAFATVVLRH